ncbi:MAG: hypothetical protein H7336_14065 [Bacteriovorax sp.]|nr:hypothetical protein [Bacteriovorax sp.]
MKSKSLLLLSFVLFHTYSNYAHAQDDEMTFPDSESSVMPAGNTSSAPPVIIDESDSQDVSDVEEYDG